METYLDRILTNIQHEKASTAIRVDREVYILEEEIILLNINQIERHEGSDNQPLVNENPTFTGFYQPYTVSVSITGRAPKTPPSITKKNVGQPYNFVWRGDFFNGFVLEKQGKNFKIYSTGEGEDKKKEFFDGYKNLYGLNIHNENDVFNEITNKVLETQLKSIYNC